MNNKVTSAETKVNSSTKDELLLSAPLAANPVLAAGWISLKYAVPPFGKAVIITDKDGVVSLGRIYKINTLCKCNSSEIYVSYEWKSYEPYVHQPTHWMPLPDCS